MNIYLPILELLVVDLLALYNGSGPLILTQPFLKFDTATGAFLKFDMRRGPLSDRGQGHFLNSTCDMGLKIFSDMHQANF